MGPDSKAFLAPNHRVLLFFLVALMKPLPVHSGDWFGSLSNLEVYVWIAELGMLGSKRG